MNYRWYDAEVVTDTGSEALRFVLPRGIDKGEQADNYCVEVWHARHGLIGLCSVKTLRRVWGRASRYQHFVLDRSGDVLPDEETDD